MAGNEPFKPKTRVVETLEREELIALLSDATKKVHRRFSAQRFRAKQADPAWMAMGRLLSQMAQALNQCLKDEQLDELGKRIEELEGGRK